MSEVAADDALIALPAVKALTGLSQSSIYDLMGKKTFPRPAKIGAASRWSRREVANWIAERLRERSSAA